METGQIFPAGRDKKSRVLSEGSEQWLLTMGLQKNRRGQTQFQKGGDDARNVTANADPISRERRTDARIQGSRRRVFLSLRWYKPVHAQSGGRGRGWRGRYAAPQRDPDADQYVSPAFLVKLSPWLHDAVQKKDDHWITTRLRVHFTASNTKKRKPLWTNSWKHWVLFFACWLIWPSVHSLNTLWATLARYYSSQQSDNLEQSCRSKHQ